MVLCLFVCLFSHLSVTCKYCIDTAEDNIVIVPAYILTICRY